MKIKQYFSILMISMFSTLFSGAEFRYGLARTEIGDLNKVQHPWVDAFQTTLSRYNAEDKKAKLDSFLNQEDPCLFLPIKQENEETKFYLHKIVKCNSEDNSYHLIRMNKMLLFIEQTNPFDDKILNVAELIETEVAEYIMSPNTAKEDGMRLVVIKLGLVCKLYSRYYNDNANIYTSIGKYKYSINDMIGSYVMSGQIFVNKEKDLYVPDKVGSLLGLGLQIERNEFSNNVWRAINGLEPIPLFTPQ